MSTLGTIALYLLVHLGSWALIYAVIWVWLAYVWPPTRRARRRRSETSRREAGRIRGRMRRMARSTLLLTPSNSPRFSKLGGAPEMPRGTAWPRGAHGPLAFLAQLDLAEVRTAGGPEWLPEIGKLYVFNDDQRYGFADHMRVLFCPERECLPLTPPADLPRRFRFGERRAGFLRMTSVPSLDWLGVDVREAALSDEDLDQLVDAPDRDFGDELQHRIGGYPSEIQERRMSLECEHLSRGLPPPEFGTDIPPAIARAARSWRLLLQIDSDPALGMNWGDAGRLYVFVREQHARAGNFKNTVSLWDTY